MYFWFSKIEKGKRLATRVEEGMCAMIQDGTYNKIFDKYYWDNIVRLNLNKRRMFKIDNPNLGPETPFSDKALWL